MTRLLNHIFQASLIVVLFFFLSAQMNGTHIVGGDMYYTYVGNDNYEVTLTVYRDCGPDNINGTPFDDFASIGVYETNGGWYYSSFEMDLSSAEVDWVPVELENPCFILPPDVCVERAQYTEVFNLPDVIGGYTLVYARCCRNASIVNLDQPEDQGTSIVTYIPGPDIVDAGNSSPQFNHFPPVALCANAEFYFDGGATDEDGDSLVYAFCTPFLGGTPDFPAPVPPDGPPFQPVDWSAGFSFENPVTSNPQLTIDPATGQMTGTATEIGRYALAICVSEYRDGILINTIMRDFQFNVTICDPNIVAAIPPQTDFCSGAEVSFQNNSINSSFFFWDFGVADIDSDTSNLEEPVYTYPVTGEFTVTLIANPGWPCADTSESVFTSYPAIDPEIIVGNYLCENDLDYYDFEVDATLTPQAVFEWDFGPGSVPQFANTPTVENVQMNPEASEMNITLTITDNGCDETDEYVIDNPPDPIATIAPQESFCEGFTYEFQNESEYSDSWYWNYGAPGGDDFSTLENPAYTFPDTGHYQIMLVAQAPFTCSDTAYLDFEIYGLLDPQFDEQPSQCLEGNSFDFFAEGATTNEAQYEWIFGEHASIPVTSASDPQDISFDEPGWYDVTLTISENGCTESVSDSLWVVANFLNEFDIQNVTGCPPLIVTFSASSVAEVPVYYLWEFGDGSTGIAGNMTHVYENPGTYDVTVTASTLWGCVESETVHFPNAVVVRTLPIPGFTITPQILDILDPYVEVNDSSFNSVECFYIMSDGGNSNECDFGYGWTEAGIQTITQIVTSEYGCVASVSGQVIINGFLFFAPNSFTPNNDGLNDYWIPESTGISQYHLQIFDRWGEVIFETMDSLAPWTGGVHDGSHFAPDGIYNYRIRANDLLGLPHEFTGHICLIR